MAQWQGWHRGAGLAFLVLGCSLLVVGYALSFWEPKRRWSQPTASARYVGSQVARVRSNLLSSVELSASNIGTVPGPGSEELRQALFARTAQELGELRLQSLVPFALKRPIALVGAAATACLIAVIVAPIALAQGWTQLVSPAKNAPFDGASLVQEPLVGDVDIYIEFPDYTGKAGVKLPASSGDFEAMPGSRIEILTRVHGKAAAARIVFSDSQELSESFADTSEQEMLVEGDLLRTSFSVQAETFYRFAVTQGKKRQVEARARHIVIRADKTPTVELYAPADALDVAKIKRLELAYVAEDDFGISKVELVYQADGDKEFRQTLEIPNLDPSGTMPRSAQLKYLWDLAALPLHPGVQIRYHIEVTDNDNVLGPNVGLSKAYSLRLFSPRERHEDLMARQKELAEHMLSLLAARLTGLGSDISAHRSILRMAGDIVVEMGGLVSALKSDELASKALQNSLEELRNRMDARTRREESLIDTLEGKNHKSPSPAEDLAIAKKISDSDDASILELEDDVLTLSDWLQREELENLLSISDEIEASRARLDKLFAEFERTGSPEILAEIERELRALERRMSEMAEKSSGVAEDVLDRFVNSEALQGEEETDCLRKVSEFLQAGAVNEAKQQLAKCGESMDQSAKALEDALKGMRGATFSEAEKLMDEKLDALADLSQDQEDIAKRTEEIYERYVKAASELKDEMSSEAKKHAGDTLNKLRKKLKEVPRSALTPFAKEEFDILEKRLEDAKNMLDRGELAEALSAARYANRSLETVQDELQFSLDEGWTREGYTAEKAARASMPLAKRLIEQLEEATPKPSEILDKEDRAKLDELRRKQKSVRSRSQALQKELESQGEKMPGKAASAMQEGIGKAMQHMERAEKQMQARDPSSARQEAQEASKRLEQAQENARGAARQQQQVGQSTWREEPIRIPGAEDYKAPEKFREEILDAMKDDTAPSGFAEQVKRYYKDIIQ